VLWDVIGRSMLKSYMCHANGSSQMIPSNEKSIAPMRLLLPGFVAVSHLEVKLPVSGESQCGVSSGS
jgi:hypothetical protein